MITLFNRFTKEKTMFTRSLSHSKGHIFVVGDIHGCYSLLMQKLDEHNFDFDNDLLISVGDLIDKGPENIDCLTLINQQWFTMVRGNHEEMCILGKTDLRIRDIHLRNGGAWFYSLPQNKQLEISATFSQLPILIELKTCSKKIGFVHADIDSNDWELFKKDVEQGNYQISGLQSSYQKALWGRDRIRNYCEDYETIRNIDEVYLGHTIVKAPIQLDNCFYIDIGSFWSKDLFIKKLT